MIFGNGGQLGMHNKALCSKHHFFWCFGRVRMIVWVDDVVSATNIVAVIDTGCDAGMVVLQKLSSFTCRMLQMRAYFTQRRHLDDLVLTRLRVVLFLH